MNSIATFEVLDSSLLIILDYERRVYLTIYYIKFFALLLLIHDFAIVHKTSRYFYSYEKNMCKENIKYTRCAYAHPHILF